MIFTKQNKEKTIEVIVDEDSVWLSQKLMAELFGTTRNNITMHLTNILEEELKENSVYKEFLHTAEDGKNYKTKYYNLDAIIAVGFKVNSKRAIEFRLWAISILKQYSIKGYVLDNDMPYYMRGLKNYKEDKMFLIDIIRYEQDLYGNIVNEMLDFDLGDK